MVQTESECDVTGKAIQSLNKRECLRCWVKQLWSLSGVSGDTREQSRTL